MPDLNSLQQALGISFNDRSLLEQALVHSSYSNENPAFTAHSNERLEFLGDAVLGLIIAERLHHGLPPLSEGEMTRLRSTLVRQSCLARIAATIGLGNYLYLGKGEEAGGGRNKPKNLAAALEAVIAAVYLDHGPTIAQEFVLRLFDTELDKVLAQGSGVDYKSQLQEFTQAKWQLTPTYHLVAAAGPDHDKTFTVEVRIDNTVLAKGSGKSKKAAETEAARAALRRVFTQ
ncbi:MAG TPA: ribonuclease III [Dehalococcoidia bacterium]|nr:ribonuclease III [Dehalococcoidia bacterium]